MTTTNETYRLAFVAMGNLFILYREKSIQECDLKNFGLTGKRKKLGETHDDSGSHIFL